MHHIPRPRRAAFTALALTGLLLTSGCVSTGTNRTRADDHGPTELQTLTADNAQAVAKRVRSYAIADTRTKTPLDVQLFGLPQAPSLAEATERIVLARIHAAGGFGTHKAFSPVLTSPDRRLPTTDFVPALGTATPPSVPAGTELIDNAIIGAGGAFVLSRVHSTQAAPASAASGPATPDPTGPSSAASGSPASTPPKPTTPDDVLVTNIETNETVSADKLLTTDGSTSDLRVDDAGALRIGTAAVDPEHLTPLGRDVALDLRTPLKEDRTTDLRIPDYSCALLPCIALTYDDGPGDPTIEQELLADAKAANIRLTYFLMGRNVTAHPALVKQIAEAGHEIGNHSYSHPSLDKLTPAAAKSQIRRTDDAIAAAGVKRPTIMRPPYGALSRSTLQAVGTPAIRWDVDTLDWKNHSPKAILASIQAHAKPGSVVLMHSIHQTSVDAAPRVFSTVEADGYYPVTVSELFEGIDLKPGAEYFCRGYGSPLCSNPEHPAVHRN